MTQSLGATNIRRVPSNTTDPNPANGPGFEPKGTESNKAKPNKELEPEHRFGIGEWYGKSFAHMPGDERRQFAALQHIPKEQRPKQACPFLSRPGKSADCHKEGGICSLRSYERSRLTGEVKIDSRRSTLITICPSRFEQNGTIHRWVNDVVLPNDNAISIGETPFLRRAPKATDTKESTRKAGRIDNILVVPATDPLRWCPIEKQAVYFSGKRMMLDFQVIATAVGDAIPFPVLRRRPDYRSSSAKRLLPQLETKVTALSKWGKKTAVVVDEDFFREFTPMEEEQHITNSEIIWFVVRYELQTDRFTLIKGFTRMATLKNAIQAVVAAQPIPQPEFEQTLKTKLQARLNAAAILPSSQAPEKKS
ncbi:MAG: NotI family restriction endonuclease [Candidatus Acidiferrales bacterium]